MRLLRHFFLGTACLVILCIANANAQNGVAVCVPNADQSDVTCTIHQPVVDQRAQNGFWYSNVVFQAGDLVTITAGGCVQTGGHFKTWKRYVNPSGPNSDHLYFGTIGIPGVTPPGFPVRIQKVQQYHIPAGVVAPNNVLVLGYKDDGYGDNGYYSHDDGTENQCKEGTGLDGGPAWVIVLIQHGLGNKVPPPAGPPFDMISKTMDTNGLSMNPEWQYEKDHPGNHPDASVLCAGFPYVGPNYLVGYGTPPCTPQGVTIDGPSGSNDAFCSQGADSGKLHGHVNWWPATVKGTLIWAGHDSPFSLSSINPTKDFGDDDYNFWLYPSNISLLAVDSHAGQSGHDSYIETEFDSDETIDNFNSQWWNTFHDAVDKGGSASSDNSAPNAPASLMVNQKQAIVTGLVGLDSEHGAYTELHPVYAMAIHMNSDPNNDQWAFFARNWGDEGFCSQDQHYWDLSPLSIFIPEPVPSSDYSFVAQDLDVSQSFAVQSSKVEGGLLLTFALGAPENRAFADGSVTIRWVPIPAVGHAHPTIHLPAFIAAETSDQAAVNSLIAAAAKETKESDAVRLPPLAADKVNLLRQQLQKPAVAKRTIHVQATRASLTAHPQKVALIARPKTRAVPDPVKAAKDQRRHQAICAAYDNNIAGIPNACAR